MKTASMAAVLALLLALCLMAAPSPAKAAQPPDYPSFMWYGGMAAQLDLGIDILDWPMPGDETNLHWRITAWVRAVIPGQPAVQKWWILYDWNGVLYDNPAESGIHCHWGTGIVTTKDPGKYWPGLPPQRHWLWTSIFGGVSENVTGVHLVNENWTGVNENQGLKAYCTWRMADPNYQDMTAKVWILN